MNPGTELRPDDIADMIMLDCDLLGKEENGWYQQLYGHQSYTKGDMISFGLRERLEKKIKSKKILDHCYLLLSQLRWRWPRELDHDNDATNYIQWKLSYARWWIVYQFTKPKPGHRLYRPRTNLTRDPFIMFFTYCAFMGEWNYIKWTSIPFHLYSKTTWAWHNYLKGDKNDIQALERYKRIENRGKESKHDYVKLLKHYRRKAVLIKLGRY